jgi:hypothetical protein
VDIEGPVDRFAILAVAHDVDARFGLKPHYLGDRVGEAPFKRCLLVRLFVAEFFQIRNHGRLSHHAADMAYDDATIRPQDISPPGSGTIFEY